MSYQGSPSDKEAFFAFKNIMIMLHSRGYEMDNFLINLDDGTNLNIMDMDEYDLDLFAHHYVMANYRNNPIYSMLRKLTQNVTFRMSMSTSFLKPEDETGPGKVCVVYFATHTEKELPKNEISLFAALIIEAREYFNTYRMNDALEFIIISHSHLNNSSRKTIESISTGEFIQVWEDIEIKYNPLNNKRGSKPILKSIEETNEIIETMGVDSLQLPSSAFNDKIAKYLGARAGQMIDYIRINPLPGLRKSKYPRTVSERLISEPKNFKKKK